MRSRTLSRKPAAGRRQVPQQKPIRTPNRTDSEKAPKELLKYRPSEFSSQHPEAEVGTDEVLFTYEMAELDGPDEMKDRFEEDLLRFKQWLIWSKLDVDKFVQELAGVVDGALVHRREALDAEDALMESLGYPEVKSDTSGF